MLKDYENVHFTLPDGAYDETPCPNRNTDTLKRLGMDIANTHQKFYDIEFLPKDYFCPLEYDTLKMDITTNTYSIHHYSASWTANVTRRTRFIKKITCRSYFPR